MTLKAQSSARWDTLNEQIKQYTVLKKKCCNSRCEESYSGTNSERSYLMVIRVVRVEDLRQLFSSLLLLQTEKKEKSLKITYIINTKQIISLINDVMFFNDMHLSNLDGDLKKCSIEFEAGWGGDHIFGSANPRGDLWPWMISVFDLKHCYIRLSPNSGKIINKHLKVTLFKINRSTTAEANRSLWLWLAFLKQWQ